MVMELSTYQRDGDFFRLEETVQPLVPNNVLKESLIFKPRVRLTELDKVLRRDDAKILLPEIINEEIITKIEEARIGRGLVDVIRIDSDSYSWLEETGFNAEIVPEGAEIPIKHATWEKFYVSVLKIGVRPVITKEMV
jgi:HK97 family phage major capsid protein